MITDWKTTKEDQILINAIVKRACDLMTVGDPLNFSMDLAACHLHGCPLKLQELLEAPNFDFIHDVSGISHRIDRETGKLARCFMPRFAQPASPEEKSIQGSKDARDHFLNQKERPRNPENIVSGN